MKRLSKWLFAVAVSTGIALPSTVFATNGMTLIGFGTKARGVGGVAIAMPQDALAGAVNPATISWVGSRVDAGMDFFVPIAEARLGPVTKKSSANRFVMPAMGGTYKFNRKVSMGFSAVPFGGGGSRYNVNLFNAIAGGPTDETLGINLMIMQMNPTMAYKVNKQNSIGASLIFSIQTFRAFGLDRYFRTFTQTFADDPANVNNLSNNGNDWSYGAGVRIGWMGNYMKKKLSVGASYASRVYMTEFDKYSDLFAEQGDLDTPPQLGFGISYKFTPKLTIGMDIMHTFYEDIASIGNASAPAGPGPILIDEPEDRLGNPGGLGFGWENQTAYKIGAIYDYNKAWTLRAGWNFAESPIDETNGEILFNILAPAVTQQHLTLGATYSPSKRLDMSFSYVHAFEFEQNGPTVIGSTGSLSMFQNSIGVSIGYDL